MACGLFLLVFAWVVAAPALRAQYELESGVHNWLTYRSHVQTPAPVGPLTVPTGAPTLTPQFANVVESSSSSGPISTGVGHPSNPKVILLRSSIGTTFASGVPRYFLGDQITPPSAYTTKAGVLVAIADPASFWRAEPIAAGEQLINPNSSPAIDVGTGVNATVPPLADGVLPSFYYSPHAKMVFSHTPGSVVITWRSLLPQNGAYVFYEERFSVSSATATPVRTMYWTEKSFNGPRVDIPSGKVVTVNPVFSNVFPETVTKEYVVVGASGADPNAEGNEILRTLWFEKSNGVGELHAYNITGRLLVEYLGDLREDGSHEFLGLDIVNVSRALPARTATILLGDQILPYGELPEPTGGIGYNPDPALVGSPVATTSGVDQTSYYGSSPRPDGSLTYNAERENDIEDRVTFYWLESLGMAIPNPAAAVGNLKIQWPKYLNKYLQVWPSDLAHFATNRIGIDGSSPSTGTGLSFPGGNVPEIVYQDSPEGDTYMDATTQRLMVNLVGEVDQMNRSLLRFTGTNGGVWYVRLLTGASNLTQYGTAGDLASDTGLAYVGERIKPPSSDLVTAGYIAAGTSYSPQAYINPFEGDVTDAEKGAIIPVNAIPGQNTLTVWWFKRTPAKSAEFTDFYTPAAITVYTLAYRESSTVFEENFDGGASGWSNSTTTTLSGTNRYLGSFGTYAVGSATNVQVNSPVTSKTFAIPDVGEAGVEISFRILRLDTWDNESFRVYVNDRGVIDQRYQVNLQVLETASGKESINGITYTWTVQPEPNGYAKLNAGTWYDQTFSVLIHATPDSDAALGSLAALKVGFGSNLNEPIANESFGIDDFVIRQPVPAIVLASNQGTGVLPTNVPTFTVYNQPDSNQPGYNPNEEHALLLNGRGYALRDDLNVISGTGFTSLPRVLLAYTDPADSRPAMKVYKVMRENQIYDFDYGVTAGTQLNVLAPMPLPFLPLPLKPDGTVANLEVNPPAPAGPDLAVGNGVPALYAAFTYKDRKGYDWVYRGPHAGTSATAALGMQFYYTMRSDFAVPGRTIASGTVLPYLRPIASATPAITYEGDPVSGTALTVVFRPVWPDSSPTLNVGESLILPKNGLPAVRGQTSARVLYQQSLANHGTEAPSVTLHDPTRGKTVLINAPGVGLSALPPSLKTTAQNGNTYFQLAQPHLQERFFYNPLLGDKGGLQLNGEFVDEIAGEDYLLLNALSDADELALKGLVLAGAEGKASWDKAIELLATAVETFKEDPARPGTYIVDPTKTVTVNAKTLAEVKYSDTAVDSYALTAQGKGDGYVTLLFGDGLAFTPQGEPVGLQIIRVVDDLYIGDLKAINAANPLDEQTSLRHSGDYAARPDLYTFEWAYFTTTNGTYPAIYLYSTTLAIGGGTAPQSNLWQQLVNPTGDLGESTLNLNYGAATTVTLPRSLVVNEAGYTTATTPPSPAGKVFRNTSLVLDHELPTQLIFSSTSGVDEGDGFVVYVNQIPVLAYNLPPASPIPPGLALSSARTGLVPASTTPGGLLNQFALPLGMFVPGANTIEVALYSAQSSGASPHEVEFRLHKTTRKQQVVVDPADPNATSSQWIVPNPPAQGFSNTIVVGGSAATPLGNPLLLFTDNFFTMRYRAKDPSSIVSGDRVSEWTQPVLVESWVKRVLDGINPFNQRQTDLYNNPISTDVSFLTQAGTRWEGDVALNLDNIDSFGLIEIYETVLNRVKAQSIDADINDAAVNNTLLLVAGYLNDLYMTLGNEAYDDAQNPTIQIDGDVDSSDISSARFSFEGQVRTLVEETLGLLRGRDDFFATSIQVSPAYNRLYWNYTNGISSGEPIYAVNYNIKEKSGGPNANGVLDAADAQYLFPQGHGDAYGHYLSAVTGYYKLLNSDSFTWVPNTESVSVLGQTVQIDYFDERKFTAAAAALARTGVDIVDFTARDNHLDGEEHGWSHLGDRRYNSATGNTRAWGTDEWSSRVYQGAYFNWLSANAMLPAFSNKEGIEKIDRTTVPELTDLVTSASTVLSLSAGLQAHLNTLGLPHDAMTFDISPSELAAGKSHFEQTYGRAIQASLNAKNAFHQAGRMNQLLRQQNNTLDDYNTAVSNQESAYQYELSTLFGTPYAGDIGPGKLYAQGYTGPDLYHYYFINQPSTIIDPSQTVTVNFREPKDLNPFTDWLIQSIWDRVNNPVQYTTRTYQISKLDLAQFPPAGYGKRAQPGKIQGALLATYTAQVNLREATNTFNTKKDHFDRAYQMYIELIEAEEEVEESQIALARQALTFKRAAELLTQGAAQAQAAANYIGNLADSVRASIPTVTGPLAFDTAFVGRGIAKLQGAVASYAEQLLGIAADAAADRLQGMIDNLESQIQGQTEALTAQSDEKMQVLEFQHLYEQMLATSYEIARRLAEVQQANEEVSRLLAQTNHILSDREVFRQRSAAVIQGYRTRDLVYRDLRNEELSQYKSLFDLAQTYVYAAAKAYDYETGLLSTEEGESFVNNIIGTSSLGEFSGNNPVASGLGDSGLAGVLAGLDSEWLVAEGRLGINNPDRNGTVFSLRQELFRIRTDQPTADDNSVWQQVLQQHVMSNVLNDPDVALYCGNLAKPDGSAVPGIVISFSTTIEPGLNFFGWPLAGGDHAYSPSTFATKIFSTGIVFEDYVGMDPYAVGVPGAGGPASSNPNALSATPYVYLIPAGLDVMRAPPLGDANIIRSWAVKDQALPLPKNLGSSNFADQQFFTPQGTLNEQLWIPRKHQAFRAVDDPVYFYSSIPAEFTNTRLISRSVWNTQWKLVIPANTLLNNEQLALDQFIRTVSDIKLFLRTYSTAGN